MLACRKLTITTLLTTSMLCSPALAQDTDNDLTELDTVTVYATKSEQQTFDVPAMVTVVDPNSAGNSTASAVSDIFETTPGIEFSGGPRRNGENVNIRGFDDEAVLTLIDGRRQNFEAAHDGRFFLDPSLLKSAEVVRGANSSIYGGGAVGGVLAFETKDAADFLDPGETYGYTLGLSGRTANSEISPIATGYYRSGNWDVLASALYKRSGDIEQGDGNELDAEDNIISALLKTSYNLSDTDTLKFSYQRLNNDGTEPNNGQSAVTTSNNIIDKEVTDDQFSIKYEHDDPSNNLFKPSAHVYYNATDVEETEISGSNAGRLTERALQTIGFTLDNQSVLNLGSNQKHTFTYGGEVYRDIQNGARSTTGTFSGSPDGEATNFGFFVQDEIALTDIGIPGELLIIPAARYDQYESEDESGNSQEEGEVSPKIGISYKPTENYLLFGSWAQAFRAPNLTEIYPSGLHFPGVMFVFPDNNFIPNPDLKPETVTTIELGAGIDFDSVVANNDRIQVKGSVYESKGDDFITQEINLAGGTTQNVNIPNAEIRGWEVEGSYSLNPVNVKVGLSRTKAENEDTGADLDNSVPLTLVSDISYDVPSLDSTFGWRGRFAKNNDEVSDADNAVDGYSVHDLYYRYKPAKDDDVTFDFGVENVLDKSYNRNFSTLKEEGRSFVARATWKLN